MPRFYVEKDGEWNIFSTITDDFVFDEFVCLDALKARLLYERYKELTEDIDSLLTDKPSVNVMDYEEAMKRRKEQTMKKYIDTEWLENNAKEYSLGYYEEDEWATPLNVLDSAPSIDIVRCRECIHCADDWNGNQPMFTCELGRCGESVQPNDFCSYGERGGE